MTKFQRICSLFALVVGIVLIAGFASKIARNRGYSAGYSDALASIKPDTEYVDKPIYIDKPVPVVQYRDTGRVVFVKVPVKDSTGHADTTAVPMHPEVKQYEDSTYRAQVSGIQPNLDWIEVHQRTAYITRVVPEYKYPTFALSPTIDAFVFPGHFSLGGGLAIDYWRGRWQLSVEAGYGILSDHQTYTPGWYGRGGVKFNLLRR